MRNRKMGAQIADGALVYLAEREGIDTVFTLGRRDFLVYRLGNGRSLRILP
jgi:predicted nucleic acid-binding protein